MDVESRLRACLRHWRLDAGRRPDGGFCADVFACTTPGGADVVVKLTATPKEARAEAAALTAWAHTRSAVHLIDVIFEQSAFCGHRPTHGIGRIPIAAVGSDLDRAAELPGMARGSAGT